MRNWDRGGVGTAEKRGSEGENNSFLKKNRKRGERRKRVKAEKNMAGKAAKETALPRKKVRDPRVRGGKRKNREGILPQHQGGKRGREEGREKIF